jgi:2-polyprenyl-3-methyl-5-hydroxy-6-metoxy-1,4-benzoquinol methylase
MRRMLRRMVPELMDSPNVDPIEHRRALAGLRRINRLSRAAAIMCGPIVEHFRHEKPTRIRMLDVASGGGDVPIEIARRLQKAGSVVELTLFDQSDVGLVTAVERAKAMGIQANAEIGNALEALPQQAYDLVTCSLFLHHLDRDQCIAALNQMKSASRGLIVVSDLVRSRFGLMGAMLGCHLLSRSPLVHYDGPASVRASWTPEELHDLARHAGLDADQRSTTVRRCYPCRMLLVARTA